MSKFHILPYFHPSTIIFVDDNSSFLEGLKLRIPPSLAYDMFTNPSKALDYLNTPQSIAPLADRCFSMHDMDASIGSTAIYLDLSLIELEISRASRFLPTAVVVVDYDMPRMNGLDFCHQIHNKNIQRILLTGVADEQIAIEAFNAGLIDRFIRKNDDHALSTIFRYIDELQNNYFANIVDKLSASLAMQPPQYFQESAVLEFISGILTDRNTLEYYMVSEPAGFLLVNSAGAVRRLILQNSDNIAKNIQYAITHSAPSSIITELKENKTLAYFYQEIDSHSDEPYPWEDFIFASQHIEGTEWYAAFTETPPLDIEYQPEQASYNSYLQSLDDA